MPSTKRKFGDIGERKAANYLISKDFQIVGANYRKPFGEIDIIAEKDGVIRFVEVKTSKFHPDPSFTPEIRIDARKRRNLKRVCEIYIFEQRIPSDKKWQIDVISVILNDNSSVYKINHIENAIFERQY